MARRRRRLVRPVGERPRPPRADPFGRRRHRLRAGRSADAQRRRNIAAACQPVRARARRRDRGPGAARIGRMARQGAAFQGQPHQPVERAQTHVRAAGRDRTGQGARQGAAARIDRLLAGDAKPARDHDDGGKRPARRHRDGRQGGRPCDADARRRAGRDRADRRAGAMVPAQQKADDEQAGDQGRDAPVRRRARASSRPSASASTKCSADRRARRCPRRR